MGATALRINTPFRRSSPEVVSLIRGCCNHLPISDQIFLNLGIFSTALTALRQFALALADCSAVFTSTYPSTLLRVTTLVSSPLLPAPMCKVTVSGSDGWGAEGCAEDDANPRNA